MSNETLSVDERMIGKFDEMDWRIGVAVVAVVVGFGFGFGFHVSLRLTCWIGKELL